MLCIFKVCAKNAQPYLQKKVNVVSQIFLGCIHPALRLISCQLLSPAKIKIKTLKSHCPCSPWPSCSSFSYHSCSGSPLTSAQAPAPLDSNWNMSIPKLATKLVLFPGFVFETKNRTFFTSKKVKFPKLLISCFGSCFQSKFFKSPKT